MLRGSFAELTGMHGGSYSALCVITLPPVLLVRPAISQGLICIIMETRSNFRGAIRHLSNRTRPYPRTLQ